jgi:hypothetical protein
MTRGKKTVYPRRISQPRKADILQQLQNIQPGHMVMYYIGHDLRETDPDIKVVLDELFSQGKITYASRRFGAPNENGIGTFEYFAIGLG